MQARQLARQAGDHPPGRVAQADQPTPRRDGLDAASCSSVNPEPPARQPVAMRLAKARAAPGRYGEGIGHGMAVGTGPALGVTVAKRSRLRVLAIQPTVCPRNQAKLFYHLVY